MPVNRGDDRQRLVPLAVVAILTTLIDELDDAPSYKRVELRSLRAAMCRLYKLPVPGDPANASAVAQDVEDADGIPLEE